MDPNLIYDIEGAELNIGDTCEKGSQLRPHIVWFGESVPEISNSYLIAQHADIFMVVGTSLQVYPAAGLIDYVPPEIPKYLIDPNDISVNSIDNITVIKEKAGVGLPKVVEELLR